MGVLWISEALPIPATALLPLVIFPLFGIAPLKEASAPYADPIIFLFMGGFMLSMAMQKWNLHRRIALGILAKVGSRPHAIIWGFLLATTFLSMWVSNAATAMMMMPIGLSVTSMMKDMGGEQKNFSLSLMLAIGYASTIGGLGTPIGTPPNGILVGALSAAPYHNEIGFLKFLAIGLPMIAISLPVVHLLLTRWCHKVSNDEIPGAGEGLRADFRALGPMGKGEIITAAIFVLAALLWITRERTQHLVPALKGPTGDTLIAMFSALLLFFAPVNLRKGEFVLDWKCASKIPWEVLVLFGGGLSLAKAFETTKFADWLGSQAGLLSGYPIWAIVLITSLAIIFLSELASNTAIAAAFVPIAASMAVGMGQNPLVLALPVTFAASCAFMLPVGTPPSAIVYASGQFTLPQMAKAGIWLNLLFAALITIFSMTLVRWVFGV
jgi:sodium-dependent dicarboxylate transporter 2/3/5